ncbi:dihydrofolate reductase ASCRUDRAFT_75425 [Ascoidea rubescens DSM 1968]|uniref:Dihydrofolate reductase n=1 Tax=Ascoidea rubescens DSM 1968 TaxID=1344418 RepID=A0A1D2VIU7_9ASCO|nr:hypothetical protein ASCRUDRAFT_75425 [Ascoidea rubescens DSM 1968]ODV61407.1 hypothetical protein ASCRUDRAFT_75425 [Ascoidea rubescens DSM 1968]
MSPAASRGLEQRLSHDVVVVVAALLPELGIGYQGRLPWRLRREMKYFVDVTTGSRNTSALALGSRNAVIMGRRTWESIPLRFRPLKNRLNVVLSRLFDDFLLNSENENIVYSNGLDNAIERLQQLESINRIFIIGGAEVYNLALKNEKVNRVLLTEINSIGGLDHKMDTFLDFGAEEQKKWEKKSTQELRDFVGENVDVAAEDIEENGFRYRYTLWHKKQSK